MFRTLLDAKTAESAVRPGNPVVVPANVYLYYFKLPQDNKSTYCGFERSMRGDVDHQSCEVNVAENGPERVHCNVQHGGDVQRERF